MLHFSGVGYVNTDTDDRHRQSRWIGSSIPQQPSRRKKSSTTVSAAVNASSQKADSMSPPPSDQESAGPTTSKSDISKSHKKRSTMNSRDSAYDYSGGLGISTLADDDKDDEGSIHGSRTSMSKRRGKRVTEDDDEDNSPTSSNLSRSKRRRGSNDDTEDLQDPPMDPVIPRAKPKKSHKKQIREDPSPSSPSLHPNPNPSDRGSTTPLLDPPVARPNKGGRPPGPGKRKSNLTKSERVDSEEPLTPTLRKGTGDDFRPARARVPQARSGLNEMRKRVGAILEFVGRLRGESGESGEGMETSRETPRETSVTGNYPYPLLYFESLGHEFVLA